MRSDNSKSLEEAQLLANVLDAFLRLTTVEHMGLASAARALKRPKSLFSGKNSMLSRYVRGGLAALLPKPRAAAALSDLTKRIEELGWFIPAANFFYLNTNRNEERGSVPEAIRRTLSLPNLPIGWRNDLRFKFAKKLAPFLDADPRSTLHAHPLPVCPSDLRAELLARERAGKPLVPDRIARQIATGPALMQLHRRPHETGLKFDVTSGSSMFIRTDTAEAEFATAGAILESDDGSINFPVCIPWTFGDPTPDNKCASKYGVLLGRFQWLRSIDVGTRFRPGWAFVARPRSSYRGEDILSLLRALCIQHGIWREYRFEQGAWKSVLVANAIERLGAKLHTVYTSRGKPFVEGGFNYDWTKLSVHFPHCDLGRYAGDTEQTNKLVQACRAGYEDPRKLFPMLADALAAFEQITEEQNTTPVNTQWGRWIPQERWLEQTNSSSSSSSSSAVSSLRPLAPELTHLFCPIVRDWTIRGTIGAGKVNLFEDISPEFAFSANWLYEWDGVKCRFYFDPRDYKCRATVEALESRTVNGRLIHAHDILGTAEQINETTGYIRTILGWGDDDHTAGLRAKQQNAAAMRRDLRTHVPNARGFRSSEERDGISVVTKLESASPESSSFSSSSSSSNNLAPGQATERSNANPRSVESPAPFLSTTPTGSRPSAQGCDQVATLGNRAQNRLNPDGVAPSDEMDDFAARLARAERFEKENAL